MDILANVNSGEIMYGAIARVVVGEIWGFIKKKYAKTEEIKKLKEIKAIKWFWFILVYVIPLSTILFLIFENKTVLSFQNIALFIIICVSFIFNILMSHIRNIYEMTVVLTSKSSENDLVHQKAINIILEDLGKDERIK